MLTGNETAFPAYRQERDNEGYSSYSLTTRQYFAAMAMQGMLSNSSASIKDKLTKQQAQVYVEDAVLIADALIAELNK